MKTRTRLIMSGLTSLALLVTLLYVPGFPWSERNRHKLNKVIAKAEVRLARWRGEEPKFVTVTGQLRGRTAAIRILDSNTYWASLTDDQGRFKIPDVLWYPGVNLTILMIADKYNVREKVLVAPTEAPEGDLLEIGEIDFDACPKAGEISPFRHNSISYQLYDDQNEAYYHELFDRLTAEANSDEERMVKINDYVFSRKVMSNRRWSFDSPRQVLEEGSMYCGNLSMAMAAIVEAGNYQTRRLDISDGKSDGSTHVLIEVFYENRWHLFDPTFGLVIRTRFGEVASYDEIRQSRGVDLQEVIQSLRPKTQQEVRNWLPSVYHSGLHHYYIFRKSAGRCPLFQ